MCYFTGVMDDNRGRATRCDVAWTARIPVGYQFYKGGVCVCVGGGGG